MRLSALLITLVTVAAVAVAAAPTKKTVDERIKDGLASGAIKLVYKEQTTDACDRNCDLTFTSTTDGDVVVKPGERKYFERKKDVDDYTKGGGYYWKCCGTQEKSRIPSSTYIEVTRKEDTGAFVQYWVEMSLADG